MVADPDGLEQRVVFRGPGLTSRGGPARELLDLVEHLITAMKGLVPTANPHLALLQGSNSIEVRLYAPEDEVQQAQVRRRELGDEPNVETLPDTTLAAVTLAKITSFEDPVEAAEAARHISQGAANSVRNLAAVLYETKVELELGDVRPDASATPQWSLRVVEHIDASEEIKPAVVVVRGILQGANSGNSTYELVTERDEPLDPVFGNRRKAGDTLKGELTPRARRDIREENLWDQHVEARVRVIRRRVSGGGIHVEDIVMTQVKLRFRRSEDDDA